MTGWNTRAALGSETDADPTEGAEALETDEAQALEDEFVLDEHWAEDAGIREPRGAALLPALALLTIVVWTAFFVWANWGTMVLGAPPSQIAAWFVDWSVPVLLVVALWLLAMRSSRREAGRFTDAAQALARESRTLESRLTTVNRELSLARDFIASQSRDLESLGRLAAERLSENAERLQALVQDNGAQVDRIGAVSDTALANMDRLRDQLPVIANAARDVTSQIGNAGQVAQGQLEELVGGFDRLTQSGDASEKRVETMHVRANEMFASLEDRIGQIDQLSVERFAALREQSEAFRLELESRETDTLAAIRRRAETLDTELQGRAGALSGHENAAFTALEERLGALRTELDRMGRTIDERSAEAERIEIERLAAMEERLALLDAGIEEREQNHLAHVSGLAERGEALAARLRELDADMAQLAHRSDSTRGDLGEAADALAVRLAESRATLSESGTIIASLTDDSVRLLEIIRSSTEHSQGALTKSISSAEARLASFEQHANGLSALIAQARDKGEALAAHVEQAQSGGVASLETLAAVEARLASLAERSDALAAHARDELTAAIDALQEASASALDTLRSGQAETIREIGERIGAEGSGAIKLALREGAGEAIAELEVAALQASQSGHDTALLLRDQLGRVNDLVSNLESRVTQAREKAEEQMDGNFARNMALIVESLNSSAIDITKAFDTEVTDTAWASYLRGDRGIFTRRAVRLLDNSDARAVADVYQLDDGVRETVNRYIHDFEAMLRTVLSTRDGNAMAVTLLSSDMGKLYVALAQSIERLRN